VNRVVDGGDGSGAAATNTFSSPMRSAMLKASMGLKEVGPQSLWPQSPPSGAGGITYRGVAVRSEGPSANSVDKSTEEEGVTSGESDSKFPLFILKKCAEMLDPTGGP